jgi:hypothetical protein
VYTNYQSVTRDKFMTRVVSTLGGRVGKIARVRIVLGGGFA